MEEFFDEATASKKIVTSDVSALIQVASNKFHDKSMSGRPEFIFIQGALANVYQAFQRHCCFGVNTLYWCQHTLLGVNTLEFIGGTAPVHEILIVFRQRRDTDPVCTQTSEQYWIRR